MFLYLQKNDEKWGENIQKKIQTPAICLKERLLAH